MFDILNDYQSNDHFFFSKSNNLEDVCNAPKTGIGVYLVYALKGGKVKLIYIGAAGKVNQKGKIENKKDGFFDSLVNGIHFEKPRKLSWKEKIKSEKIEALDIYWYETFDKNYADIPSVIAGIIMQQFFELHGELPKWNKAY